MMANNFRACMYCMYGIKSLVKNTIILLLLLNFYNNIRILALDPVVPSVQDGVNCLGAVLDGVDGRRRPSTTDAQNWSMRQILVLK